MKIRFESNDNLPLGKILNFPDIIILVASVFHEDSKYSQVYLHECVYESVDELKRVCNFCAVKNIIHKHWRSIYFQWYLKKDDTETKIY